MEANSTLESLTAESARLREVVAKAQQELDEIETLLRLAEKYRLSVGPAESTAAAQARALAALGYQRLDAMTIKDRILLGAESVLSDGRRRLSREIVADLAKLGVIVGGSDPPGNLSSYLSREKDRFESDIKAGGWTLKRLTKKARPEDVAASSGLSFNGTSA